MDGPPTGGLDVAGVALLLVGAVRRWVARLVALPTVATTAVVAAAPVAKAGDDVAERALRNTRTVDHLDDAATAAEDPLVITKGGTYTGTYVSHATSVPAVTILTREPVVLQDAVLRGPGALIHAPWSDVDLTVRNVRGEATYPTVAGEPAGRFVHAEGYRRIAIRDSVMVGTSGIYLNASHPGATVQVTGNLAVNVDGRLADGAGGYDGVHYVQFVQLNAATRLRDAEIAWNRIVNEPGASRVEDVVSLFKSSGRPGDPIRVHHNLVQGAFPTDPAADAYSGGGIMLGDGGGAHQVAYANTVVNTTNYGVAISGGRDVALRDNVVVGSGVVDGTPLAAQNVGLYVWNHAEDPAFADAVATDNRVAWAHPEHGRNDWWYPDATTWTGNVRMDGDGGVTKAMERAAVQAWFDAAAARDVAAAARLAGLPPEAP